MSRLNIGLSDVYQAYRLTKGIRQAVRLTAQHMGLTPVQVCDRLGLDVRWSEGPSVELDIDVTVHSKDRNVARAVQHALESCLGDPVELRMTPTRAHLVYKKVKTELPS